MYTTLFSSIKLAPLNRLRHWNSITWSSQQWCRLTWSHNPICTRYYRYTRAKRVSNFKRFIDCTRRIFSRVLLKFNNYKTNNIWVIYHYYLYTLKATHGPGRVGIWPMTVGFSSLGNARYGIRWKCLLVIVHGNNINVAPIRVRSTWLSRLTVVERPESNIVQTSLTHSELPGWIEISNSQLLRYTMN